MADAPHSWSEVSLSSLCERTALGNPEREPEKTFLYVDVSSVSNESFRIVEPKELLGKYAPSRARKLIRANDVIFATVRPTLKRVALVPPTLDGQVCSTGFCVLRAKQGVLDPKFLYFYLLTETIHQKVESLQDGATYPAIRDSDLLEQRISLPSVPEQKAIAQALDAVQNAKEVRQQELSLELERKAALTAYLFTYGTRSEPTKQTQTGEMPESWRTVSLEEVSQCLDHKRVPVKLSDRNKRPGRIPYYGASGLAGWIDEFLFDEPLLLVGEDGENLESRKLPIAYSIAGKSWVNNHAHVLRIQHANQEFVRFYLNSIDLRPYLTGTTRPKLNKALLLSIPVPRPDANEEAEIASLLLAIESKTLALKTELERLDELFQAMLEELMTGRRSAVSLFEEHQTQ